MEHKPQTLLEALQGHASYVVFCSCGGMTKPAETRTEALCLHEDHMLVEQTRRLALSHSN